MNVHYFFYATRDDSGRNTPLFISIADQQCPVTEIVDQTGQPASVQMYQCKCGSAEVDTTRFAGDYHPVADIRAALIHAHGAKPVTYGDPLVQLPQFRQIQNL